MLTFEEAQEAITQIADNIPPEILKGLNCGIVLLPEIITDNDGLLVLGMYHIEPLGLGRYVTIYYGSIMEAYGYLPSPAFKEKLKDVLYHELVHHLESLAGDRSLEIQDAIDREKYLRIKHK